MALAEVQIKTVRTKVDEFLGGNKEAEQFIKSIRAESAQHCVEMAALWDEILAEKGFGEDAMVPINGVNLLPVQIVAARKEVKGLQAGEPHSITWWAIIEKQAKAGDTVSIEFLKARSQILNAPLQKEMIAPTAKADGDKPVAPPRARSLDEIASEMGIANLQATQPIVVPPVATPPVHVEKAVVVETPTFAGVPMRPAYTNDAHDSYDDDSHTAQVVEVVETPIDEEDVSQAALQRISMYANTIKNAQKDMANLYEETAKVYAESVKMYAEIASMHKEIMQTKELLLNAMRDHSDDKIPAISVSKS